MPGHPGVICCGCSHVFPREWKAGEKAPGGVLVVETVL